jgi:hypothetical protein
MKLCEPKGGVWGQKYFFGAKMPRNKENAQKVFFGMGIFSVFGFIWVHKVHKWQGRELIPNKIEDFMNLMNISEVVLFNVFWDGRVSILSTFRWVL